MTRLEKWGWGIGFAIGAFGLGVPLPDRSKWRWIPAAFVTGYIGYVVAAVEARPEWRRRE